MTISLKQEVIPPLKLREVPKKVNASLTKFCFLTKTYLRVRLVYKRNLWESGRLCKPTMIKLVQTPTFFGFFCFLQASSSACRWRWGWGWRRTFRVHWEVLRVDSAGRTSDSGRELQGQAPQTTRQAAQDGPIQSWRVTGMLKFGVSWQNSELSNVFRWFLETNLHSFSFSSSFFRFCLHHRNVRLYLWIFWKKALITQGQIFWKWLKMAPFDNSMISGW